MTAPSTLVDRLAHWANTTPDAPALNEKRAGRWQALSWSQYHQRVRALGQALIELGHQPGECVALVGANRPEWVQCQFAIQAAQGIPAPIYVTNTAAQAAYIVKHSRARILIADGAEQVDKLLAAEAEGAFPELAHIITFDLLDAALHPRAKGRLRSFDQLLGDGRSSSRDAIDARIAAIDPAATCMLIYTSGTTGVPKAVELSHAGQLAVGASILAWAPFMSEPDAYHCISYLPLCHQAEQLITNVATLMVGGQVYFCPDLAHIKEYLTDVRPTVFLGVPRVWEKFEAALRANLGQKTGFAKQMVDFGMQSELAAFDTQVERGLRKHMTPRRFVARKLVVDKVKTALGLDRLQVAITGSAPIAVSTQRFFASLGIGIHEAYGLSETSGLCTLTDPLRPRFGTVGRPLSCAQVRISDEGEIQVQGVLNTKGYLHMPEESAALFTEDGWLKTGDLGAFDDEGNVKITGRIKELLITAGGKNVAPVELEHLIGGIDGVGQVVVVGDRKPYLSALVTLDPEAMDALRERIGVAAGSARELAAHRKLRDYLEDQIGKQCNAKVARYQTIKKFEVLPDEFSVDGGELTATMKLRRNVIADKYADVIERFYSDGVG
ncbi:MAG: long-chain fatty acid--CoA ligase [Myxococcales bacterium]|nr:long-chain fatty acid--CoA ligase [Myxococcales bacterium]MCB9627732.1 long-chain fatty acid--CoA ligase [Sandaracinaceae bacterium]